MFFETRWPVIIFSRIIALGEKIDVFPVLKMPADPQRYADNRDKSADTVFLLPDTVADVYACSWRADFSRITDAAVAYAAALFVLLVRGLPEEEIRVRTPSGIYDIKRLSENGKYGVSMPKYKALYTKTVEFADKTDLIVRVIQAGDHICNVVKCTDAEMMSSAALKRLLLSSNGGRIASVAISEGEKGLVAKAEFLNDSDPSRFLFASSVAASFVKGEGKMAVDLPEGRFDFLCDGVDLYAFEQEPNIFTFHGPDL